MTNLEELEVRFPRVSDGIFLHRAKKLIKLMADYGYSLDLYGRSGRYKMLKEMCLFTDEEIRRNSSIGYPNVSNNLPTYGLPTFLRFYKNTDHSHHEIKQNLWHIFHETNEDFELSLTKYEKRFKGEK